MIEDRAISEFLLRPASNADVGAVRSLVFAILAEFGLKPDPSGVDADLDDLETNYFSAGGWFGVLIGEAGKVIGCVGLKPIADGAVELRKMYLAASHRGRGLGRHLLNQAMEEARRRGFQRMMLETATRLRDAVAMYERHGFRRLPEPPHVCRCDLVMERDLG